MELIEVSVENHNILIVLWRWNQVKLITKFISIWADYNMIKDSIVRILTIASLGVFYPFIKSNLALWSYTLFWTFELFLIIQKYKIGRQFALLAFVLSLSPLLLLIWILIWIFDYIYEGCFKNKRKLVVPIEQMQSYNLDSQQPRLFDISSR